MSAEVLEFTVEAVRTENDLVIVAGRVCDLPLQIGDTFDTAYTYPPPCSPSEFSIRREPWDQREVFLCVTRIFAYRKDWSCIDPGLTAEITLQGQNGTVLKVGDVLARLRSRSKAESGV